MILDYGVLIAMYCTTVNLLGNMLRKHSAKYHLALLVDHLPRARIEGIIHSVGQVTL